MKLQAALLLTLTTACLPDELPQVCDRAPVERLERELGCEVQRAEALAGCHQYATHPRAGCRSDAQDAYGTCLAQLGEQARGDFERCRGTCLFLRDTCEEHVRVIVDSRIDCAAEQAECEGLCASASQQSR